MREFLESMKDLIWVGGVATGVVLWATSSFSSAKETQDLREEMKAQKEELKEFSSAQYREAAGDIKDIKKSLETLDKRSIETLLLIKNK